MNLAFRFLDWPLRAKMAGLLVVASLLPLGIATWIDIRQARERLVANSADLLAARADDLANEMDAFHLGYQHAVDRLAHFPALVEFCQAQPGNRGALKATVHGILGVWPPSDRSIRGIAILDLSGEVVVATEGQLAGLNLSYRSYVREAMRGAAVISDIHVAEREAGDVPTIAYLAPVHGADGSLVAVAVLWVRASALWDMMKEANGLAGPGSFAVLFDHRGIRIGHTFSDDIVFHPGGPLAPSTMDALVAERRFGEKTRSLLEDVRAFPEQFDRALAATPDPGVFKGFAPVNQQWNFGVARRLDTAPWTVFYMLPEQSLNAQIAQMTRHKTVFAGVIMIIALVAGALFAAFILKPIGSLASATGLIAGGDLAARVPAGHADELGGLATSFNTMAGRIEAQAVALQGAHDDLELRVQERTAELMRTTKNLEAEIIVRKQHELEIARINRLYAALSQVNQAIVMTRERGGLFAKVCQVLVEHGGFRMAWVGLLDPATRRVLPASEWGDKMGFVSQSKVYADERPEGQGPVGTAIREGRTYVCNDFAADPRTLPWREAAARIGYRASAVFPIRQDGAVCGSIAVYAGEIGFFKDREIALLEEAAGDVSFALDNFTREDVRRKAEQGMRVSEERFRAYVEQAADAMFVHDFSGRFIEVNQQACANLGYTREELLQLSVFDIEIEFDLARAQAAWSQIRPDQTLTLEGRQRRKDGSIFPVEVRFGCFDLEGKRCYLGIVRDITERKRAEEALRETRARLNSALTAGSIGTWTWDIAQDRLTADEFTARAFSLEPDAAAKGLPVAAYLQAVLEEDRAAVSANLAQAIASCGHYDIEYRVRQTDGSLFWLQARGRVEGDAAGKAVSFHGAVMDITARKQAEAAVRQSEQYFRFLNDLVEATRTLADPAQIMAVTARMLGEHLHASRCAYADVEKDSEQFTILHDYTDGCASTVGRYQLSLFGPRAVATLLRGEALIIRNVMAELLPGDGAEMFNAIGIQAIITCPLVKEGGLRAMLAVHQATPRDWQPGEIRMVQDVGERCWATIERRRADQQNLEQLDELLRWQEVMLNREDRVEALKVEVNTELARQAQPPRYSKPTVS